MDGGVHPACRSRVPDPIAEHANGTSVVYTYDERTFRLKTLVTTRASDGVRLQDLRYFYDPVGNICELHDRASTVPLFTGPAPVSSDGKYAYDSLYRLVEAQGREHPGQTQPGPVDLAIGPLPHPNDLQALARYTERYTYDAVGNIERMQHLPAAGSPVPGWTRRYRYAYQVTGELASNRLLATSIPGDPDGTFSETYEYRDDATNTAGAHGSMTRMPHLPGGLDWDHADRMKRAGKLGGGDTYFTYDGAGQRVRKVYVHSGLVEERIYLGGYELYRQRAAAPGAPIDEERQTLHVMDDQRRVAMAETSTVANGAPVGTPTTRWRFQLDNHLGSAMLEVDQSGNVITYEEYHPYGTTAFHTAYGAAEVSAKRYRYTGKEKDEETGLYYHGARYFAAWLGRWTAVDPAGVVDGPNLYRYSRDNPVCFSDPGGTQTQVENTADPTNPLNFVSFEAFREANPNQPDDVLRQVYDEAQPSQAAAEPAAEASGQAEERPAPPRTSETPASQSMPGGCQVTQFLPCSSQEALTPETIEAWAKGTWNAVVNRVTDLAAAGPYFARPASAPPPSPDELARAEQGAAVVASELKYQDLPMGAELAGEVTLAAAELALGAAQALARGPSVAASGAGKALRTTAHGAERIAGAAATRGGVLSEGGVAAVRQGGRAMTQADGATVRILQNEAGRFNVVVEDERGIITTFESLSQKSLDRLRRNYGWE